MAKNSLLRYMVGAFTEDARRILEHNTVDHSVSTSQLDIVSSTTLVNIPGLVSAPLRNNVLYKFVIRLPVICTANNGCKFAFKQSVASMLASIRYDARMFVAAGIAAPAGGTTATDQALLADNAAAVSTYIEITGTFTVANGPSFEGATLNLQAAQHTSSSDTFSVFKGATMELSEVVTG